MTLMLQRSIGVLLFALALTSLVRGDDNPKPAPPAKKPGQSPDKASAGKPKNADKQGDELLKKLDDELGDELERQLLGELDAPAKKPASKKPAKPDTKEPSHDESDNPKKPDGTQPPDTTKKPDRTKELPADKPGQTKQSADTKNPNGTKKPDVTKKSDDAATPLDPIIGEDIGERSEDDPLARISREMRRVEGRLKETDSGEGTQQAQERIIAEIEMLLTALRQQPPQGDNSSGSPRPNTPSGKPAPKSGKPNNSGNPSQTASKKPSPNSTERLGKADAAKPESAPLADVMRKIWGHLPERARQQMLETNIDYLLPKYELQIEDYFRRLAEESRAEP